MNTRLGFGLVWYGMMMPDTAWSGAAWHGVAMVRALGPRGRALRPLLCLQGPGL